MSAPEVQLVAVSFPNEPVTILSFVIRQARHDDDMGWTREATDEAIEQELGRANITGYSSWRRIEPSEVPTDRTFREAWADSGIAVTVDMPKARAIHRNYLRSLRTTKFATLDVEYMRADERGDGEAKMSIAARKQALRNVTADPAIDAAATPEDLKRVLPAVLL